MRLKIGTKRQNMLRKLQKKITSILGGWVRKLLDGGSRCGHNFPRTGTNNIPKINGFSVDELTLFQIEYYPAVTQQC